MDDPVIGFCVTSAYHSLKNNPGEKYQQVHWKEFLTRVLNPEVAETNTNSSEAEHTETKKKQPGIVPSLYLEHDARSFSVQENSGMFVALTVDADGCDVLTLSNVLWHLLEGASFVAYPSYSDGMKEPRARAVIPLDPANPEGFIPGKWYRHVSTAFAQILSEHGIPADIAAARHGQIAFFGLRGPASLTKPIINESNWFSFASPLGERLKRDARDLMAHSAPQRLITLSEGFNPAWRFNETYNTEHLLNIFGFTQEADGNWRFPEQTSKGSLEVYDDGRWSSFSQSGKAGILNSKGQRFGDAFDLFTAYAVPKPQADVIVRAMDYGYQMPEPEFWNAEKMYHDAQLVLYEFLNHGRAVYRVTQEHAREAAITAARESETRIQEMKQAERSKWVGDWLNDIPFEIEPDALEWAAWHAPGILGDIVRTVTAQRAIRKSAIPPLTGAIAAICRLTQGKHVLQSKFLTPPSIMMYVAGGTGSGKTAYAEGTYHKVMKLVKPENRNLINCGQLSEMHSGEAVHHYLATRNRNVLLLHDEKGAVMAATKGESRASSTRAQIIRIFTGFEHGVSESHGKTAGVSVEAVDNPTLSALYMSTPKKLFDTLTAGDAESGEMGRFLFIPLKSAPYADDYEQPDKLTFPQHVVDHLNKLATTLPPISPGPNVWSSDNRHFWRIGATQEASGYMRALSAHYDAMTRGPMAETVQVNVQQRCPELIWRLATVAALAEDKKNVELFHCEWANVILQASYAYLFDRMEPSEGADDNDSPQVKIRKGIRHYFERSKADHEFRGNFGKHVKVTDDGDVAITISALKRRLQQTTLRRVNISSKNISDEITSMLNENELALHGIDGRFVTLL